MIRKNNASEFRSVAVILFSFIIGVSALLWKPSATAAVLGAKKVIVLRVYFKDYAANSRYTQLNVEGFFTRLDTLWSDTSYNKINIQYQVSSLFQLPDNRSLYIDDLPPCEPNPASRPNGDLSCGTKYQKVLNDAVANVPAGLDWTNIDAVMVVMAETNVAQFHRGQANKCNLAMGPGGATKLVGCAIFSENPSNTDIQVWGRWAHEIGHSFQAGGPAHPSNYNNEFELMDSNYPGQTGVFEKQSNAGFPGWMPTTKYQTFNPSGGGGIANIWAMEYPPSGKPNIQAVKVRITDSLYYLVSVRRRIFGDELNGDFQGGVAGTNGIPDEGVLIERVVEGADQWVTVKFPPGTNRNRLWHEGDPTFDGGADGVVIQVVTKIDPAGDNYEILVRYNKRAMQPDVALEPWTSPPGNTWETTDIWIDSPLNGYGTYRYGFWNDLKGNPVPRGNGDDPGINQVNRLYARVRNIGESPATNVVVNWQITDPPGVGIAGANGWLALGSVDKTTFPALASIAPGSYVDVYMNWTPNFPISAADLAAGRFSFHTCLRVKLNTVAGETVLANQDGDREQENISYFQAPPPQTTASLFRDVIHLRNDDLLKKKFFYLSYKSDLPSEWGLSVNKGVMGVQLNPGEVRDIPILIKPKGVAAVGSIFGVDVQASSLKVFVNDMNPKDLHSEYRPLGGVRVETRVLIPPTISCVAEDSGRQTTLIRGKLSFANFNHYYQGQNPFVVALEGVGSTRNFLPNTLQTVRVQADGSFSGILTVGLKEQAPKEAACFFAGTTKIASAASGYVPVLPVRSQQTDLTTTITSSLNNQVVGGIIPVRGVVKNAGPGSSAATRMDYVLSNDALITAQDKVLASVPVPTLASGVTFTDKQGLTPTKQGLAASVMPGNIYLGTCVVAISSETNTGNNCSSSVLVTISAKSRLNTNDFNGDGKSDLLLRNSGSGTLVQWQMNGTSITTGATVSKLNPKWKTVGIADFNGDGKMDLLFRNTVSGAIVIWQMNGSTIASGALVYTLPLTWQIKGARDFTGDGKADILLRNTATGVLVLWQMNGTSITTGARIAKLNLSWQVAAVADYNGDGKADLLLRNTVTGAIVIWLMNGSVISSGALVYTLGLNWKIVGSGDYGGDGKADIVLHNTTSGLLVLWQMNGSAISGGAVITKLNLNWQVKGSGDYNGDGKSDLLLRNSAGAIVIWLMNGSVISSGALVYTLNTAWTLQ